MDKRFTIVLPAYNYRRFLGRALDSVFAQEGEDFSVLVVDDGSTDGTREFLQQEYRGRLDYLHQKHRCPNSAAIRGVRESRSEFIIFMAGDDQLVPGMMQKLRAVLGKRPDVDLVCGRTCPVTKDGRKKHPKALSIHHDPLQNFLSYILGKFPVSPCGAAFRRSFLQPYLIDGKLPKSYDTLILAHALLGGNCSIQEEVFVEVHDHDGRFRNHLPSVQSEGHEIVDMMFAPKWVGDSLELQSLQSSYHARISTERGRNFYQAGSFREAWQCYHDAFSTDFRFACTPRNLRRYLVGWLRTLLA